MPDVIPRKWLKVTICAKKLPKVLAVSEKMSNFAPMKQHQFIITGKNVLTGHRDQLSRPMGEQEAQERLERERQNRRYQHYQTHKLLKIERLEAVQLTIQFKDHEQ